MTEVPVKIEKDGSWVTSKIDVTQTGLSLREPYNRDIQYRSIIDLRQHKTVLVITATGDAKSENQYTATQNRSRHNRNWGCQIRESV
jgi:taxis protein CheF